MTQQFENFVNAALDKSLASDVTLPTANEIPVFTGIGRQVTGKTIAELGLASKDTVYIPNSTNPFTLETKTLYMIGDFLTTTYGDLYLQLPPLTASTVIEIQLAYNIEEVGHVYITPSGTDLFFGEGTTRDLKDLPLAPGCTVKLFFHSVGLGWVGQANYSDHLKNPKIHPYNATNFGVGHTISSKATSGLSIQIPDANIDLGDPITSLSFDGETGVLTATRVDGTETTVLLTQDHMDKLLNPWGSSAVIPLQVGYTYRPSGSTAIYPPGELVYLPAATVDAFNFPESVPIKLITGNSIINAGYLHLTPQVGETMYHSSIDNSLVTSTYLPIPNNSEVTCYMIGVGKWYVDIRQDQNYLDTDHFTLVDPVDRTKSVVLNVAPIDVGTQRTITVPDADVNLGNLSSVATTDFNDLSGTRTRIVSGSHNTVSGTDNVVVGCSSSYFNGTQVTALGAVGVYSFGITPFPRQAIILGTSSSPRQAISDGLAHYAAAFGGITCCWTTERNANGVLQYVLLDGSNTPSAINCPSLLLSSGLFCSATHEVEFIVTTGNAGSPLEPKRTYFAKRKVYVERSAEGVATVVLVTLETDQQLGDATSGSITCTVGTDQANNRLLPSVTVTAGTTQASWQASVRITSHYNRK